MAANEAEDAESADLAVYLEGVREAGITAADAGSLRRSTAAYRERMKAGLARAKARRGE